MPAKAVPSNKIHIEWVNRQKDLQTIQSLADKIINGRRQTYEDNWALMSLTSLLSGALYKTDRARTTQNLLKQLDDVLDAINYLRFSAVRILKEISDRQLELPY
jgi:uncharacterized protein YpiB (UPF0302 family)